MNSLTCALQPSFPGWLSCCAPPAERPLCRTRAASLGKHGRLSGIISALLNSINLTNLHALRTKPCTGCTHFGALCALSPCQSQVYRALCLLAQQPFYILIAVGSIKVLVLILLKYVWRTYQCLVIDEPREGDAEAPALLLKLHALLYMTAPSHHLRAIRDTTLAEHEFLSILKFTSMIGKSIQRKACLCIAVLAPAHGRDHVKLQQNILRQPESPAGLIWLALAWPPVLLRLAAEVHEQRLGVIPCIAGKFSSALLDWSLCLLSDVGMTKLCA